MQLERNQLAVFANGHKAGCLEARWSEKHKAFYYVSDELDEEGRRIAYFTTTVIDKPQRKRRKFSPSKENCKVMIHPLGGTEKSYVLPDGSNGKTRHCKEYYRYIAKSICYVDENGNIFAPYWAMIGAEHY